MDIWTVYENDVVSKDEMKKMFLQNKERINDLFSTDGVIQDTLLTRVCAYGDDEIVEFLLKDCGADPNIASSLVCKKPRLDIPDLMNAKSVFDFFDVSIPSEIQSQLDCKVIGEVDKKSLQYILNMLKICHSKIPISMMTVSLIDSLCDLIFNFIYGYYTSPIESAIIRNRYYEKPAVSTIRILKKYGALQKPWTVKYSA
jgi:hypothetical protein